MKTLAIQKINKKFNKLRFKLEYNRRTYDNSDITDDSISEWYYNKRIEYRHHFVGYVNAFRDMEIITNEEANKFIEQYFNMENEVIYSY